jgi:hypothetical protein
VSELDAVKAVLSDMVVDNAVKDFLQQCEAAKDCLFFQVSEEKFHVKKFHWESFDSQDPVTRHDRTRIVEATAHQSGSTTVTCSCRRFMRKGRPCRHMRCILGRGPLVTDYDVKQLKWFEACHGREEQFTRQSKSLIENRLPGPPIQISLTMEDSRHTSDNLCKVVVRISADENEAADDNMEAQGFLDMFTKEVDTMNNSGDNLGWGLDEEDANNSPA